MPPRPWTRGRPPRRSCPGPGPRAAGWRSRPARSRSSGSLRRRRPSGSGRRRPPLRPARLRRWRGTSPFVSWVSGSARDLQCSSSGPERFLKGASALDELEERRALAGGLLLLVEEREPGLVELLEELVPGDVLELILAGTAREVEAQDAGVIATALGAADRGGRAVAGLGPLLDGVVVGRGLGIAVGHARLLPARAAGSRRVGSSSLRPMRLLLATHHLSWPGGSGTYLLT